MFIQSVYTFLNGNSLFQVLLMYLYYISPYYDVNWLSWQYQLLGPMILVSNLFNIYSQYQAQRLYKLSVKAKEDPWKLWQS